MTMHLDISAAAARAGTSRAIQLLIPLDLHSVQLSTLDYLAPLLHFGLLDLAQLDSRFPGLDYALQPAPDRLAPPLHLDDSGICTIFCSLR